MPTAPRKQKIMVVDDDPDTRALVKTVLERQGYEVTETASGKECLDSVQKAKPDLVLLDIMMPQMSGWETFEKLKEAYSLHGWNVYEQIKDRSKGVKVAFLTVVQSPPKKIEDMKQHGLSDYILKPFIPTELVERVRKILESALIFFGLP